MPSKGWKYYKPQVKAYFEWLYSDTPQKRGKMPKVSHKWKSNQVLAKDKYRFLHSHVKLLLGNNWKSGKTSMNVEGLINEAMNVNTRSKRIEKLAESIRVINKMYGLYVQVGQNM